MKLIGLFLFIIIVGFTIFQSYTVEQEKQLIVGTWACNSTPNWKIEFESTGKCNWYYPNEPTEVYYYTIYSEYTPNGIEHTFLKLVNINNQNEIFEYSINSIVDNILTLETLGGFGDKYLYFTKQ